MLAMRIEKYSFHSFDQPASLPEAPEEDEREESPHSHAAEAGVAEIELQPVFFTEAQIQQACDEAHHAGYRQGEADGRAAVQAEHEAEAHTLEQEMLAVERQIAEALTGITGKVEAWQLAQQYNNLALVKAIAYKIAGHALEQYAPELVTEMLEECGRQLTQLPTMQVFVHQGLVRRVRGKLEEMLGENASDKVQVTDDPALGPYDCRVAWETGSATRSADAIWQEIEAILNRWLEALGQQARPYGSEDSIALEQVEAHMPPDPQGNAPEQYDEEDDGSDYPDRGHAASH